MEAADSLLYSPAPAGSSCSQPNELSCNVDLIYLQYILISFSLVLPASKRILSFMLALKILQVFLFSLQHSAF
jgi:hypothetical protein